MASSKDSGRQPSPSTSSTFLPLGVRSRRGSRSSFTSQVDRETLNSALDQIHTSASRSATLTTFNDFAPPPRSSSGSDTKSLADQISQHGLSGMYTRLKSSVTGVKQDSSPASKDGLVESETKRPQGTRNPRASPLQTPQAQSPLSNPSGMISAATAAPVQRDRSAKSPVASLSPVLPEEKHSASVEKHPQHIPRDKPQLTAPSPNKDASTLPAKPSPVALSTSDPTVESTLQHVQETSQSALTMKMHTPASSPRGDVESRRKLSDIDSLGKAPNQVPDKQQRVAEKEKGPPLGRNPQLDLPGFRLSRITTSEGTDSQSSRAPSVAPSAQLSSATAVARQDPERVSEHFRDNSIVLEMKRKILSRDFWMKDENAKVCFHCGEGFTTFRRKHHCRLCGQIFCNNCTMLISGRPFGQASKLRVCKTCEGMLYGEDSSDYSEDDEFSSSPHTKQLRFSGIGQNSADLDQKGEADGGQDPETKVSLLRSASFRKERDLKRRTLAIDRPVALARPGSSRSLKSLSGRPHSSSQKRRKPRHQHMRSLGLPDNAGAPFHGDLSGEAPKPSDLPAFHKDSIIDPDLAPFMSDEGSSDDDGPTIASNLNTDVSEQSSVAFGGLLGALQKGRPRTPGKVAGDSAFMSLDADNISMSSTKTGPARRQHGARPMSVGSIGKYNNSPRLIRSDNLFASSEQLASLGYKEVESFKTDADFPVTEYHAQQREEDALTGVTQPCLEHIKRLLRQFLRDCHIGQEKAWVKTLVPIFLKCAAEVDPNIQRGDAIDIRHYVKLKKAPGGTPKDTGYVSGVVFTGNIALKSMKRNIKQPRILLISFPLIYARHQQHFMSLDPVIAQEREYLKNLVKRIAALSPDVLLVQRSVAGLALQYLREHGITVAYNVKETVMQALARCTQTRVVTSVERLTMDPDSLGFCNNFDVKTFVHLGNKKSYISVSGCQKDLGCTIVLRGAEESELRELKWISEFMCYVAYNSRLETFLIRDQFASGPALASLTIDPDKEASDEDLALRSQNGVNGNELKIDAKGGKSNQLRNALTGGSFHSMVFELQSRLISVSPFVNFPEPYLVLRGRDQEEQVERLRALRESQAADGKDANDPQGDAAIQKFELVKPEMVYTAAQNASSQVREILYAIHSVEYDKAAHSYANLRRRWDAYVQGAVEPFNPQNHQKVIVLFSIVSTPTADACEGPDLLGLDFYEENDLNGNFEPDVPLGEYVERLCNQAQSPCTANRCDKNMLDHHRQYVHGDGQVSIFVQKHPSKLKRMENTILMWSFCRICEQETPVVPMSSYTWKYSFGKYLELSFWSQPMHPRADICNHNIYRDHIRYFGFKGYALRVQYDSIQIVEVIVPRGTITWNVEKDLRLKNEVFQRIEERISRFMSSVKLRIKSINLDNVKEEKVEACKAEIEDMLKRVNEEYDSLIKKLREKYMASKYYELIPLNRAARYMQEKVADWDSTFADFERNYFPSEKDIQQLAALQFTRTYLDQEMPSFYDLEDEKHSKPVDVSPVRQAERLNQENSKDPEKVLPLEEQRPEPSPLPNGVLSVQRPNFAAAQSGDLDHIVNQTVQGLDLAVPADSSSPSSTLHTSGALPTPVQSAESATSPQKQRLPLPQTPTRLHPNVAAKVEEMRSGTKIDEHGASQSATDAIASTSPSQDRRRALMAPPLFRTQSQPQTTSAMSGVVAGREQTNLEKVPSPLANVSHENQAAEGESAEGNDKKNLERAAPTAAKVAKSTMRSMIPRAIGYKSNDSRVTALAKHFEQMSKEFERERLRERRQRADKWRQARAYPTAASKPVVSVYRDASEAVRERETSHEETRQSSVEDKLHQAQGQSMGDADTTQEQYAAGTEGPLHDYFDVLKTEDHLATPSYPASEIELPLSDTEQPARRKDGGSGELSLKSPAESLSEVAIDLPKHDKSSLLKMLTSFWSERSASGWTPLEYPLSPYDHLFADSDVIVREDEPSTLVAFALQSDDYKSKVQKFREKVKIAEKEQLATPNAEGLTPGTIDLDVERIMLGKTATHLRYQFQAGPARMQCKVFYAEAFDAIRRKCGVSERFVESLSRCLKWDSKGGKTKSLFLRTRDERFILKSLSAVETQAFLKFAPDYFDYMSKCLFHSLPSALAKMLGFYQVIIKNPVTGTDFSYFLQVVENVFYEGPSNRMFDLKGSMRNRKVQSTGEKDEVLLDENLLEYVSQNPVYIRNHSNSILASSISNDTLFFSKQNVMDYSLIVGMYEDRKELLVGIIDYIRTYTWDKKLETWIKDRGKLKATVRSPKEYRNRFRASIPRYFPLAPSCWQIFGVQRIGPSSQQLLDTSAAHEEEQETAEQSQTETGPEKETE